jgi:hypothetical protein
MRILFAASLVFPFYQPLRQHYGDTMREEYGPADYNEERSEYMKQFDGFEPDYDLYDWDVPLDDYPDDADDSFDGQGYY